MAEKSRKSAVEMEPAASFLKTGAEAEALVAERDHKRTGKVPPAKGDDPTRLPVWQRTSTTPGAKYVYTCGQAVFPPSTACDAALPLVAGWKSILEEIEFNKHGFVRAFLRNVIFCRHQSTNGRWNSKIGRLERWGVKAVADWLNVSHEVGNPDFKQYQKAAPTSPWSTTVDNRMVSRATFFRIKDRLIDVGLIEAGSHFVRDRLQGLKAKLKAKANGKAAPTDVSELATALWIKPTDELSRIMFDPGYSATVRHEYAFAAAKKKPRGVHVKRESAPPASKNEPSHSPAPSA